MELIEALGINAKLLIVQGVGFLILLFVLKKFLFGRILDLIHARSEEVKSTYDKTDRDRQEAEKLKLSYEQKLKDANIESGRRIEEAVKEAKSLSDEIVKKSNKAADEVKLKAEREIELSRKQALAGVRDQVVNLTMFASSKLIEQSVEESTAKKLVDEVIVEVGGIS